MAMRTSLPMHTSLPMRASGIRSKRLRNSLIFLSFVGPLSIGLIVFVYIPIIWGFWLSFYTAKYSVTPTSFAGVQNYINLLQD